MLPVHVASVIRVRREPRLVKSWMSACFDNVPVEHVNAHREARKGDDRDRS